MALDPILQSKVDNLQGLMSEILAADPEILAHPDQLIANPELAAAFMSMYDDLRPGAEAFAEQARDAGVAVELYVARGVLHGYLSYTPALREMDAIIQQIAHFVKD
jgi:acetyl esterase/lipase